MPAFLDITGHTFGRLTAIRRASPPKIKPVKWLCVCSCGQETVVDSSHLRSGHTQSCGCFLRETRLLVNITHGSCKTPTYECWSNMRARCTNTNHKNYEYYGGRGIKISRRWLKFENFLADMGVRPSQNHSLDRVDVNGSYSKDNCRWATRKEQAENRRKVARIEQFTTEEILAELRRRDPYADLR